MRSDIIAQLREWANTFNDPIYFKEDPIIYPRHFADQYHVGCASLQDVEIAAIISAHLAWGRRSMIVRDCKKIFDQMDWKPYDYVMKGVWRDEDVSVHRTIKWKDIASICLRLKQIYQVQDSIETMSNNAIRTDIFGSKEDLKAPNKKICMMRRWLVRDDGKVDLGVWQHSDKSKLIIPLDVHVYRQATELGLVDRKSKDLKTAIEITSAMEEVFPGDPCLGDFALFGYGVTQ